MIQAETRPTQDDGADNKPAKTTLQVKGANLLEDSLSARVILFSLLVILLVSSLMTLPLLSHYSTTWLEERVAAAYLISISLEASPNGLIDTSLQSRLLKQANVLGITVRKSDNSILMLGPNMPLVHNVYYDLRNSGIPSMLSMLLQTAISPGNKVIHVAGDPHGENATVVEIDVGCHDLFWQAMENTKRAIGTALFTALLVSISFYGFLQIAVVSRLQRLTSGILDFRRAPADASRRNICSGRVDEIGIAEEAFEQMQNDIRTALVFRTRLAAIGMAVTKIQHDLRGTLSSVMLASNTLEASADPEVQRILPRLFAAIERSVELCRSSMSFAQNGILDLNPQKFHLSTLVDELFNEYHVESAYELNNQVVQKLQVVADRGQLYRAVSNLVRNALEAGADKVTVSAFIKEDMLELDVSDNGPGIPEKILSRLFTPFMSSTKPGSSGLGLSIAREIAVMHGGNINLVVSGPGRTVFCIRLPLPIDY